MQEIQLSKITNRILVRKTKPQGVERLKEKIAQVGYLPEKPLLVTSDGNGGYILLDGNHRLEALKALGIETAPILVDDTLVNDTLRLRRARQANEATETVVPTTFVDEAEFVWEQSAKGLTQSDIGAILGWSRGQVSQYAMLQKIATEAWKVIANYTNTTVADDATTVAFSEFILRQIVLLTPSQQLELVTDLANKRIDKKQFNNKAATYKIRNEIRTFVIEQLSGIPQEFITPRLTDINYGGYDSDWQIPNKPKLTKFIEAIKAEYEEKAGTKLILGDFNEEVLKIEDNTVDLILTDIPYNISNQGKVTKKGSEIVNAAFDNEDWDTIDQTEYNTMFEDWAKQWARIIRPGGNVITWGDKALMLNFWRVFQSIGLIPKAIIVWEKDNPNPAGLARKNLISSVEFMIWAVKPGATYTFNESTTWNRSNIIHAPLCGGNERIKGNNGETLHPTQKPLAVINPLVEVFSNRGDLIFDGFAGVGSTGEAALKMGRKFIGIELDKVYFEAMSKRLGQS